MKTQCHNSKIIKDNLGNKYCEYCLKHNPKPIKGKEWTLYTIFILILLGIYSFSEAPNIKNILKFSKITDTCDIQLNDSSIRRELIAQNCYFPDVAIKQIHQECGININSNLVYTNKNLFGLKCSCKYSKGLKNNHSYYSSYKDCIKCYVNFTNAYWEKYCRNYAEDKDYLNKLTKL